MTIETRWHNKEQTIIEDIFHEGWTWEELYALGDELQEMLDSVEHTVDLLIDLNNTSVPADASAHLGNVNAAAATREHPNGGLLVLVNANFTVRAFVSIYQQMFPKHGKRMHLARDRAHAMEIIEEARRTRGDRP